VAVNKCYGASEGNIYSRMLMETALDLGVAIVIAVLLILAARGAVLSLLGANLSDLFAGQSLMLMAGVCLVVFLIAGLAPAWMYARIPVAVAFRRFTESKRRWKLGLLFLQFTAAGLFVTLLTIIGKQYNYMVNDNPGYSPENIAYTSLSGVSADLRRKAVDEIRRMPEVEDVTTWSQLLFYWQSGNNVSLPGADTELFNIADLYWVGNDYLKMMNIPLIEGRSFTENVQNSTEIMVSRSFADKIIPLTGWTDGVIGKSVVLSEHSADANSSFTICGVYENFRIGYIGIEDNRPTVMFYHRGPLSVMLVKTNNLTPELMSKLHDELSAVMPDKEVNVYSYSGELAGKYSDSRNFRDSIFAAGLVTLLICLIGLIGYTNDEINRRRKEVAIRKVNGAMTSEVLRMFLTDISRMAVPAVVIGCIGAYFIADVWMEKFADKTTLPMLLFAFCAVVVWIVVLSAAGLNCYRAANANPADCIKAE
jgi:putative ABC transport system permease protein